MAQRRGELSLGRDDYISKYVLDMGNIVYHPQPFGTKTQIVTKVSAEFDVRHRRRETRWAFSYMVSHTVASEVKLWSLLQV